MRMKPPLTLLALAALLALPAGAEKVPAKASETPAAAAGMKAHLDPATGQLVSPPNDPAAPREALAAEKLPELKVEKVTAKAGGKKVNLQGRFEMQAAVAIGPDGKLAPSCAQVVEPGAKAGTPEKGHRHDR